MKNLEHAQHIVNVLKRQVGQIQHMMDPKQIIASGGGPPSPEKMLMAILDTVGVLTVSHVIILEELVELTEPKLFDGTKGQRPN